VSTAPRRTLALLHIAANPGATNREVAIAAGIRTDSQVSRVLSRMLELGLAANRPDTDQRGGFANAWHLTRAGERAANAARQDRCALIARARARSEGS
jgi:hypothetical protein